MPSKRKMPILLLPPIIVRQIFVKVDVKSRINLLECCQFSRNFIQSNIKRGDRLNLEEEVLRIDIKFDQITIRRYDAKHHFLWSCASDYEGDLPDFGFGVARFFSLELKGDVDSRAIQNLTRLLRPLNISCEFFDHGRLEYHLVEQLCSAVEALEVEIRVDSGKTVPNGDWHLNVGRQKLTIFTDSPVDFNIMEFVVSHNYFSLLTYGNTRGYMDKSVEEFLADMRSKPIGINNSAFISNVPFPFWQRLMVSNNIEINEMAPRFSTNKLEFQLIPHNTEKYCFGVVSSRWYDSEEASLEFKILKSMGDLIHFFGSVYEKSSSDFSDYEFSNGKTLFEFEDLFRFQ